MDLESRMSLVTRNAEEIITREELRYLLETKERPRAYIGLEPSGRVHLGTGLVVGKKISDFVEAGFDFTIFLADWHAWINNKLGGSLENIKLAGEYFKHSFRSVGLDESKVRFVWSSDLVDSSDYWAIVIRIAKSVSLQRVWRSLPIMGREMNLTDMETAWVFYPCMQAADIFALKLDVAYAGIDQRKAHMLAREAAESIGLPKPICVHTHLLPGLLGPGKRMGGAFDENPEIDAEIGLKMSKSLPGSCVYIHDSEEEIRKKIGDAFCPPRESLNNPVLDTARYVIFPRVRELKIDRPSKYGGPVEYESFEALEKDYLDGRIHPLDLKNGVADALIDILAPVRSYFANKMDLVQKMERLDVTR
jgi:tyrosyl-tRNA synthetase